MLSSLSFFVSLLFLANVSTATFHERRDDSNYSCTPVQRREWRKLNTTEKLDYLNAVKCLQKQPAKDPIIKAARTRFDEFQAYHMHQANAVHVMGQFLPWHRLFVKSYENALRHECNYKGAQPYWNWTEDADASSAFSEAPVFDPVTGFGGDGVPGTYSLPAGTPVNDSLIFPELFIGCVRDGPFANHTLTVGPGKLTTTHCLTRSIQEWAKTYLTSNAVANCTKLPTFEEFRIQLEGEPITPDHGIHDGGHLIVGGEMSNFYSSPGDPLFYMHHTNLDRIWWNWQQVMPSRLYEISGRSTLVPPFSNVTLDFSLLMGSVGSTMPLRDVMDIRTGAMCYTYA